MRQQDAFQLCAARSSPVEKRTMGSLIASCVGTLLLAAVAPKLASIAVGFGAAEYFALMLLGLVAAVVLASGSAVKAIAMVVFGLLLGTIGTDINSGAERYTLGILEPSFSSLTCTSIEGKGEKPPFDLRRSSS
jgi:TctA family transporter